jgi:hypothetical protein
VPRFVLRRPCAPEPARRQGACQQQSHHFVHEQPSLRAPQRKGDSLAFNLSMIQLILSSSNSLSSK